MFHVATGGIAIKNKVKEYRQQYRLTQQEVADLVGVSSRTALIYNYLEMCL